MKKLTTTVLMLAVAIVAANAMACGEATNQVGGALHYRAFVTRHPAQILIYDGSATSQATSSHLRAFDQSLEKAGHHVNVVDTPDALAKALAAHPYDVVITYAGDLSAIRSQLASTSREPALIPVFQRGDIDAARKQYPLALNDGANLNQYLKTIEHTMAARGS
ncbi:MAG: hypothetical protein JSS13_02525 [Proteobacteria bacterium]|nr:hypothetical protein [Pseudomonadota bacterium]